MTVATPFVSIIVPVFKDWNSVRGCLNALESQSYGNDNFEILIVNNWPPSKKPHDLLLPSNCGLLEEARPGSYAARNAGLQRARGEIIGFTDADCRPNQDWIKNAVDRFLKDASIYRIGGAIQLYYIRSKPSVIEIYDTIYSLKQKEYVEELGAAATANMFTKSVVFNEIGHFNSDLMSGGDMEWGKRALKEGFNIVFGPDTIVLHPARFSFEELKTKVKRVSGGHFKLNKKQRSLTWFLWYFFKGLKPPFSDFYYIYNQKWIARFDKLKVCALRYYLQVLSRYESLKLKMGSEPERR